MTELSSAGEPERERPALQEDVENDLAVRVRRYEPEALAQLHDEYFDRIYGFVYARIGNHPEAEDVTGQVFLRVLDSLPRFRSTGADLAPWLYKVAQEVLVARYPRPKVPAPVEPSDHSPEARLAGIREALAELPEPVQTVLMLRLVAGLGSDQIARATGRRPGAVQALQRRGLKQLRAILGRRGLL